MNKSLQSLCVQTTWKYIQAANLLEEQVLNAVELLVEQAEYNYVDPLIGLYEQVKLDTSLNEVDVFFEEITEALSKSQRPKPLLIPFGHRYPLPSKFYAKFPEIYELCKIMGTPLVYSDQEEAIGIGSLNPIAVNLVAEQMVKTFAENAEFSPYVFRFSLKASSWNTLIERQFAK